MSKNCNYIYVQGLRFRPEDITVLWKDDQGLEHHVSLRKTGTGKAIFAANDIPVSLTPKDLKKMLRKGETINVVVRAMSGRDEDQEKVMLRLDPRAAEGRKGRVDFDTESLAGLPPRALRALALEQLKTAPYGTENRDEAIDRVLWSLENLDDDAISQMLKGEHVTTTWLPAPTRLPNADLAALLLSDQVLVESLMRSGKHGSLGEMTKVAPLSTATLAGTSRPVDEVLAEVALGFLGDGRSPSGDPAQYVNAVRYVTDPTVLTNLISDPNPQVRVEAIKRFDEVGPIWEMEDLGMRVILNDSDPAVRLAAFDMLPFGDDTHPKVVRATAGDANPVVFAAALEKIHLTEGRSQYALTYMRDLVEETLYKKEVDLTGTYQVHLRSTATRPSDAVLEYLLTGPVDLGGEQDGGLAFGQGVASAIQDPVAQRRVAGNTAIAAGIRAVVVAGITDDQERAWFTDPMHPTSVRLAAITRTTATTDDRVKQTLAAARQWTAPLSERRISELARDHDPEVRRAAARELRDASVLKAMVAGDKDAAGEAAERLLQMSYKDHALFPGLLEALSTSLSGVTVDDDRRRQLAGAAARAAQGLADTAMDGALADAVRSAQAPEVRLEAIKAMRRYSEKGNIQGRRPSGTSEVLYQETLVEAAAKDADDGVRAAAAAGVHDQKALSELLESSPYEEVRRALAANVVNIDVLVRVAQKDVSPSVRARAVDRCRTIGSGAVVRDALHAVALNDSDPEVRKAALGHEIAESVCVDVARNDPDPTVRDLAVSFIRNKAVLADIATKDADPQVRAAALEWYNER